MFLRLYGLVFFFFFAIINTYGQDSLLYDMGTIDTVLFVQKGKEKALDKMIKGWIDEGYWSANIDTLIKRDSAFLARAHKGIKYDSIYVNLSSLSAKSKAILGLKDTVVLNKVSYNKLIQNMKTFYQDQGFIFTTVYTHSISIINHKLYTAFTIKKNRRMYWGDIKFGSNITLPETYIFNLLGIQKGDVFKKRDLKKLQSVINNLRFVKLQTSIKLSFFQNTVEVLLYLKKAPANNFDVLLGLQSNTDPLAKRQVVLTGTAHIDVHNAFGQGENIFAEFKQIKQNNQRIQLKSSWPYLAILPSFGIQGAFLLHKRDTLSLELNYEGDVIYNLSHKLNLLLGFNALESRLLNIDTTLILQTKQLPIDKLDLKHRNLKVAFHYDDRDNRLNPRSGFLGVISSQFGQKNIIKNGTVINLKDVNEPAFSFEGLYDSLALKTYIYTLESNVSYFMPIKNRSSLKMSLAFATIISKGAIYANESYRLGGHKVIRGFNEEELNTPQYSAISIEYRYLLGGLSNLFGFVDGAFVKNSTTGSHPLFMGVGVGMNLNIKGGVLGLSYAIGKRPDEGFDIKNSKIHFKYINYF